MHPAEPHDQSPAGRSAQRPATEKHCRHSQLALAWLLAQPLDVVPILGTKRANYVQENLAATNIAVSVDKVVYLADIFSKNGWSWPRWIWRIGRRSCGRVVTPRKPVRTHRLTRSRR